MRSDNIHMYNPVGGFYNNVSFNPVGGFYNNVSVGGFYNNVSLITGSDLLYLFRPMVQLWSPSNSFAQMWTPLWLEVSE